MNASTETPGPDALAEAAIAPITRGMIVGLGTGRAATRGILALARRNRRENLGVRCIATSRDSGALARAEGLEVLDPSTVDRIDYLFDGADEVDAHLAMLKGMHGAVVGERLAACLATQRVYLVQREKLVARLGSRGPVPVVILPSAVAAVLAGLRGLGLTGDLRRSAAGEPVRVDDGHLVIEVPIDGREPREMAAQLDRLAGVIDHGLFIEECDELLIETPGRPLERRSRLTA